MINRVVDNFDRKVQQRPKQLDAETLAFADCAVTDDFNEGVTAFNDKRKPEFKGRY